MPYSLDWLFARLKKPELLLFQNHRVTSRDLPLLSKRRIDRYRSFWATCPTEVQNGGACTFSRKSLPVALDSTLLRARPHQFCSHNYTPVVPLPSHPIFNNPGRLVVSDHEHFVLINLYLPPCGREGHRVLSRARLQREIYDYCLKLQEAGRQVLLVGDFGIPPQQIDVQGLLANPPAHLPHDREWLQALQKIGMVDCFRAHHPTQQSFSTSSRFVYPSHLTTEVDMRTTLAFSSLAFFTESIPECYYLDFSDLRFPDPRLTARSPSHPVQKGPVEGSAPVKGKGEPRLIKSPVYSHLSASHFPLVVSLAVSRLPSLLPDMDGVHLDDQVE